MTRPRARHRLRGVAAVLPAVTRKLLRERGFTEPGVITDWPAIIGKSLAEHTCPERLSRDGTLRVRVAGALATELKHLEPQIVERIATYYGYRAVTRLALVQGPLPPSGRRRTRTLRPLDEAEEEALAARLDGVSDPGLRRALHALGRAVYGSASSSGRGEEDDTEPASHTP
ncbi:MAG: DUF721 domain-containing protein [Alphaproteobacteria bacterium]